MQPLLLRQGEAAGEGWTEILNNILRLALLASAAQRIAELRESEPIVNPGCYTLGPKAKITDQ